MVRFLGWPLNPRGHPDIFTLLLTCQIDVATTRCKFLCASMSYNRDHS